MHNEVLQQEDVKAALSEFSNMFGELEGKIKAPANAQGIPPQEWFNNQIIRLLQMITSLRQNTIIKDIMISEFINPFIDETKEKDSESFDTYCKNIAATLRNTATAMKEAHEKAIELVKNPSNLVLPKGAR